MKLSVCGAGRAVLERLQQCTSCIQKGHRKEQREGKLTYAEPWV
jgi:hypothetical protein